MDAENPVDRRATQSANVEKAVEGADLAINRFKLQVA
jgi:hypothetical protein